LRRTVIAYYLNNPELLKSDIDLKLLLKSGLGLVLSDKVNCKTEGHSSPFSFIADLFFMRVNDALVWANRSGGKSYNGGLLSWLRSTFRKDCGTKILGGSFEQSQKSYKAINDLWARTETILYLLRDAPMATKTFWKNRSHVEILTASPNSVRGAHQQCLLLDEVEEMEFEIYEASLSQPQSGFGLPASTVILSTMHKRYGMMNYLMQNYKAMGMKLYAWCIWEVVENCKDAGYECSTCPVSTICPSKEIKHANGHYPISDIVKKMHQLSARAFATEWLCQSPSREGLVYKNFDDEEKNVTTQGYDESRPVELGIDWGGTNPFAVLFFQEFDGIYVQIDEIYVGNTRNSVVIAEARSRPYWHNIRGGWADNARPDLIAEWNEALKEVYKFGRPTIVGEEKISILEGIDILDSMICPMSGNPTFKVNKFNCPNTLMEYVNYHYQELKLEKNVREEPVDSYNHALDATRYWAVGKRKSIGAGEVKVADWDVIGRT